MHAELRFWSRWYETYYYYKIYAYRAYTKFKNFVLASPIWTITSLTRRLSNLPAYNKKRWTYQSNKFYRRVLNSYSRVKRRYINIFNFFRTYLNLAFKIRKLDFLSDEFSLVITSSFFYFSRFLPIQNKLVGLKKKPQYYNVYHNFLLNFVRIESDEYYSDLVVRFRFRIFIARRIYFSRIILRNKYRFKYGENYIEEDEFEDIKFLKTHYQRFLNKIKRSKMRRRRYYFFKRKRVRRSRYRSRGQIFISNVKKLRLRLFSIFFMVLSKDSLDNFIVFFFKRQYKRFINKIFSRRRKRISLNYYFKVGKSYIWNFKKINKIKLNMFFESSRATANLRIPFNSLKFSYLYFIKQSTLLNEELALRQRSFIFEKTLSRTLHYFFYKRYKYNLQYRYDSVFNYLKDETTSSYSKLVYEIPSLNLDRSILEKLRKARQAEWTFRKPIKLNRRRYLVYFKYSLSNRPAFFYQTIFIFFIMQLFDKLLSWHQVILLLSMRFFTINGVAPQKFTPEFGDIVEFPVSLSSYLLGLWSRRHTKKFLMRIRRWSYLKYCSHISFNFRHKKNQPKFFRKLPIARVQPGRSFIFDYSINVGIYTFRAGIETDENISKIFDTSVYKLYPWKFNA